MTKHNLSQGASAWSRRQLLKSIGPAAFLLAPVLSQNRATAAEPRKRRFVSYHLPNGVNPFRFWPRGPGGTDFDLTGMATDVLEPLRAKLLFVKGLDFPGLDHGGVPGVFTNWKQDGKGPVAGPSLDWFLASRNQAGPGKTPIHSLQLGVDCPDPKSRNTVITYDERGIAQPAENSPARVFDKLFADLARACARQGQDTAPPLADRRRRSILDALRRDIADARNRLGLTAEELAKLDQHESGIRGLELELAAIESAAGRVCGAGGSQEVERLRQQARDTTMPARGRIHADLVTLAFELDLTTVASFAHFEDGGNSGGAQRDLAWFKHRDGNYAPDGETVRVFHHRLSHLDSSEEPNIGVKLIAVMRWVYSNLAYLAQKMDAVKTPDGSMLDDSVILYMNNIGNGALHTTADIPCLLIGSGGGKLPTGRVLNLAGKRHGGVLTSICHAFGHTDVKEFGNYGGSPPLL